MKKSLMMVSALAMLVSAAPVSAFAQETNNAPQKVQAGDVGTFSYQYHFELGTGSSSKYDRTSNFWPNGDELTLTVSQSSSGDTEVKYTVFEVNGTKETSIGSIVVTGDKTDKKLSKVFNVDPDKKHYIHISNRGDKKTKGYVQTNP
ncbi:hypothetical protein ACJ7K1_14735 [Paenibacillus elgii]